MTVITLRSYCSPIDGCSTGLLLLACCFLYVVALRFGCPDCRAVDIKEIVTTPSGRSAPLNVIGVGVTVLLSAESKESPKITLQCGDEGAGPPPHSHPWSESFYVTKGQVLFTCSEQIVTCTPGSFVHVPGGTVHAFQFGPGGG
jgi:quercetin dioxygenase-like cupin family protein